MLFQEISVTRIHGDKRLLLVNFHTMRAKSDADDEDQWVIRRKSRSHWDHRRVTGGSWHELKNNHETFERAYVAWVAEQTLLGVM